MTESGEHHQPFIQALERLVERQDRAALAALRRGLGKTPGEAAEMHRYVVPWLPASPAPWQEDPYYLVAALFAWWYQGRASPIRGSGLPSNLGASFARLASDTNSESVERRFVALLNGHQADLPDHLRHAIGLLRTHDVPVNWGQLLRDIQGWTWQSRSVQRSWARAFWGGPGQRPVQMSSSDASAT